jgi:hypothetical protein
MFPVSFNQDRRLTLEEGLRAYGIPFVPFNGVSCFALEPAADIARIEGMLNAVIRHQPALRAAFVPSGPQTGVGRLASIDAFLRTGVCRPGMYCQIVHQAAQAQVEVDTARIRGDVQASLNAVAREMSATTFYYSRPPLLRARVVTTENGSQLLFLVVAHVITDRRSMQILGSELRAQVRRESSVPPGDANSAERWPLDARSEHESRRDGGLTGAAEYWLGRWQDFESAQVERSHLPGALLATTAPTRAVATECVDTDERTERQLKAFAQSNRATVYMVALAALSVLMRRLLGRDRVVIWSNLPNRVAPGSDRAIGWFAHSHILALDLGSAKSIRALLSQTRRVVAEALEHQHLPLGLLWHMRNRSPERGLRIILDLMDEPGEGAGGHGGLRRMRVPAACRGTLDLNFELRVATNRVACAATYSVDLLPAHAVRELVMGWMGILTDILTGSLRECVAVHRSSDHDAAWRASESRTRVETRPMMMTPGASHGRCERESAGAATHRGPTCKP